MQLDFLLVGQGLAGSLLAWELLQHNCRVMIVDDGVENASQVAAGLINPVTGMRLIKSTEVDVLLPCARQYYAKLAKIFGKQFFVAHSMLRLLHNQNEVELCRKRLLDSQYSAYLAGISPDSEFDELFIASHGALKQLQTGYLLTRALLQSLQAHFITVGCYQKVHFDYQEVKVNSTLQWREFFPKRIIFCEGFQGMRNPWFAYLPFQPVKGEILTLQHDVSGLQQMVNFGHWLIPLDVQQARLGATFDHENLDCIPTRQAQDVLLQSLAKISPRLANVEVIAQHANVRPTTLDKQPFMGHHPQFPNLSIFNGFGAKGSLQIPWYAQQFVRHLLNTESIPQQGNIARYH